MGENITSILLNGRGMGYFWKGQQ